MGKYIIKRLAAMIPVLLAVTFLMFFLTSISAGDPARMIAEKMYGHPTPDQISKVRHEQGFDMPFIIQYGKWLSRVIKGDFGESNISGKPAIQELALRMPCTFRLALTSFIILMAVGVPLGILSTVYEGTLFDRIVQGFTFFSVSMPSFWIGLMLLYILGVKLRLISVIGGTEKLGTLIVAGITFDIGYFGILIRLIRTNLGSVLKSDYIRANKAKGIPMARIVMKHGVKNSVIPVMTRVVSMCIGMMTGSAVIESIFSINGIGNMILRAVQIKDTPVIQCFVLILAAVIVVVNLCVDICYSLIDRRIQLK